MFDSSETIDDAAFVAIVVWQGPDAVAWFHCHRNMAFFLLTLTHKTFLLSKYLFDEAFTVLTGSPSFAERAHYCIIASPVLTDFVQTMRFFSEIQFWWNYFRYFSIVNKLRNASVSTFWWMLSIRRKPSHIGHFSKYNSWIETIPFSLSLGSCFIFTGTMNHNFVWITSIRRFSTVQFWIDQSHNGTETEIRIFQCLSSQMSIQYNRKLNSTQFSHQFRSFSLLLGWSSISG